MCWIDLDKLRALRIYEKGLEIAMDTRHIQPLTGACTVYTTIVQFIPMQGRSAPQLLCISIVNRVSITS